MLSIAMRFYGSLDVPALSPCLYLPLDSGKTQCNDHIAGTDNTRNEGQLSETSVQYWPGEMILLTRYLILVPGDLGAHK